jgi:hypothetical protein
VRKGEKFAGVPNHLSFSRDIWGKGEKETYTDILKKSSMEEGGRWVWQPDRPPRAPNRGGFLGQRGRGTGGQYQGHPLVSHQRPAAPAPHAPPLQPNQKTARWINHYLKVRTS